MSERTQPPKILRIHPPAIAYGTFGCGFLCGFRSLQIQHTKLVQTYGFPVSAISRKYNQELSVVRNLRNDGEHGVRNQQPSFPNWDFGSESHTGQGTEDNYTIIKATNNGDSPLQTCGRQHCAQNQGFGVCTPFCVLCTSSTECQTLNPQLQRGTTVSSPSICCPTCSQQTIRPGLLDEMEIQESSEGIRVSTFSLIVLAVIAPHLKRPYSLTHLPSF